MCLLPGDVREAIEVAAWQAENRLENRDGHEAAQAVDTQRLHRAIESSSLALVALDDDAVIGFARAMSDEAFAVYIADILVAPDRQRQGIGRALVEAILDHYPLERFHHQVLVAERGAEGFYRRLGLVPVSAYGLTAFIRAKRRA